MIDHRDAVALATVLLFVLLVLALLVLNLSAYDSQLDSAHSADMAAGYALCLASQEGP